MLVVKGDKIKQVKEIMGFSYVGREFLIDDVDMGTISFSGGMGRGVMSYDEMEKYFEKVVEEVWSEWVYDEECDGDYRIKGTLIEYANGCGNVFAKCMPEDEFDLEVGLDICRRKIKIRELEKKVKQLKHDLKLF